jgi:hypothetical protein
VYSVTKSAIFPGSLLAVAARAKWLPIGLIPEEPLIPLMRNDMVNHRRGRDLSSVMARYAKRLGF